MILFILFFWVILYYISVALVHFLNVLIDLVLFKNINVGELGAIDSTNISSIKTDGEEKMYIYVKTGDNLLVVSDFTLMKELVKDFLSQSLQTNKDIKLNKTNTIYKSLSVIAVFLLLSMFMLYITLKYVRFEVIGPPLKDPKNSPRPDYSSTRIRQQAIRPEKIKNTKLDDIGGLFETKKEVIEFVRMIHSPHKYKVLGAKLPSGILFTGSPGTGKTMLARAIANEFAINFFYVSGSDFSKPYVGMGQMYVKELFDNARRNKPSILFIDEIDSIATSRGTDSRNSENERASIINSILTEMDGFSSDNEGFMVMGATNRVDMLDSALLRPGRFDRIVSFNVPTMEERSDIINKYLRKLKFIKNKKDISDYILGQTAMFTGAEISNIINESCIRTANMKKMAVDIEDVRYACDYVLFGREMNNDFMNAKEKELTAYHEAGHAIIGMILDESPGVSRVSIVSRADGSLGFTMEEAQENKRYYTKGELICKIMMSMGGRVAEELKYGKFGVTGGATSDIKRMNYIAEKLICSYGMIDGVGLSTCKNLSDEKIETEKQRLLKKCYELTKHILENNMGLLEKMKTDLLKKNNLEKDYLSKLKIQKIKDVSAIFLEKGKS